MRKLILDEWVSVDGFAARRNDEVDFFIDPKYSVQADDDMKAMMKDVDTILLGATTYRLFVDYWPDATIDEEAMADVVNKTPKLVLSNSLKSAPWGKFEPARIITGDLERTVRELKKQPGKNVILWGSLSVAAGLLKAGLVDQLNIRVCPVAIGQGKGFFPKDVDTLPLRLVNSKRYDSGVLLNEYVAD
ncbi:MAG: dihydrofolate reductase family protein [Steroidobacteraceae bacterium]